MNPLQIAWIGGGNMAEALMRGMFEAGSAHPQSTRVADPSDVRRSHIASTFGVEVTADNASAVAGADLIFLAVKPQQLKEALVSIAAFLSPESLVVSIAAGVRIDTLLGWLGKPVRVVRVMPNTPALVGQGAAALCRGGAANEADEVLVGRLLESSGLVVHVTEAEIDAVTALSGSGPAYVFLLAEAMAAAGEKLGLSAEVSMKLATKTVSGAGALLAASEESPSSLRAKVTSKGGTTAAAVSRLEQEGWSSIMERAMHAAMVRSRELGEQG